MTNFFENYFAILNQSEFDKNSESIFKRSNEIIAANGVYRPDLPWFPSIYHARKYLEVEIFKCVPQTIYFNQIEEFTPLRDRIFNHDGDTLLLLSFRETEEIFLRAGKKTLFDKYTPFITE